MARLQRREAGSPLRATCDAFSVLLLCAALLCPWVGPLSGPTPRVGQGSLLRLPARFFSAASVGLIGLAQVQRGCSGRTPSMGQMSWGRVRSVQKLTSTEGGLSESGVALINRAFFGKSVAAFGDLDGDSVVDLCVGANGEGGSTGNGKGAVYILFMNADGTVRASQRISEGDGGFPYPLVFQDNLGISSTGLGDVDGDGLPDICVGAYQDGVSPNFATGAAYIMFLNRNGTVRAAQKISRTEGGFAEAGGVLTSNQYMGQAAAGLGDLNQDGVPDVALGAPATTAPSVFIVFLNRNGTVKALRKISGASFPAGVVNNDDKFGASLEILPDMNGDGVPDLAVGAPRDREDVFPFHPLGCLYILFMKRDGTMLPGGYQQISSEYGGLNESGVVLEFGDSFGDSSALAGDLNGDQMPELAVGAGGDDDGGDRNGAIYILSFNADSTVNSTQKISALYGGLPPGTLAPRDIFGVSLSLLGDLNGDQYPEILAGGNFPPDEKGVVYILQLNATYQPPPATTGPATTGPATTGPATTGQLPTTTGLLPQSTTSGEPESAVSSASRTTGGAFSPAALVSLPLLLIELARAAQA